MAKKVSVTWVDDVDGATPADETVTFAFDGATYEIDLSEANAEKLREQFSPWIEKARRVSTARRGRRSGGAASSSQSSQKAGEIREWARANGHEVSDRGRISAEVRAAYEAAH